MPLYDYRCRTCGKVTEVRHGFREPHTGACPSCGGELARVFNAAGIVFKGSGFYINDSRKTSAPEGASKSKPASTDAKPAADAAAPAAGTPSTSSESGSSASTGTSDSGPKKSESSAA